MIDLQKYSEEQQKQYDKSNKLKKRILRTMLNNLTKAYSAIDFNIDGVSMFILMDPGVRGGAICKIIENKTVHYCVTNKEIFQEIYKKHLTN